MTTMQPTDWSLVNTAARHTPEGRAALNSLIAGYWTPLYFYVRGQGHDATAAEDLTQSFCLTLMDGRVLEGANPNRGRFRNYLIRSLKRFVRDQGRIAAAKKRGAGQADLSFDFALAENRFAESFRDDLTPERMMDIEWYAAFRRRAAQRLRQSYVEQGCPERFDRLFPFLRERPDREDMELLCDQLDAKRNTVSVWLKRLRNRWESAALAEAESTCADPDEAQDEILAMRVAMGGG